MYGQNFETYILIDLDVRENHEYDRLFFISMNINAINSNLKNNFITTRLSIKP